MMRLRPSAFIRYACFSAYVLLAPSQLWANGAMTSESPPAPSPCATDTAATAVCGVEGLAQATTVTKLCINSEPSRCFELSEEGTGKTKNYSITRSTRGTVESTRAAKEKDFLAMKKMLIDYRDWSKDTIHASHRSIVSCRARITISVFNNGTTISNEVCRDLLPESTDRTRFNSLMRLLE